MRRANRWLGSFAAGVLMVLVVVTAPNHDPTPSDSLWGHLMPTNQAWMDLALLVLSAALAGVAVLRTARSRQLLSAVAVTAGSAVGLYLISVLAWRLHAPVSAGNGG